jgi:hypothetical protein
MLGQVSSGGIWLACEPSLAQCLLLQFLCLAAPFHIRWLLGPTDVGHVCRWVCMGWLSVYFHYPLGGGGFVALFQEETWSASKKGRNAVVFHRIVVFPQTMSSPWSTPPRAEHTKGSASPRSTSWGEELDGSFRNAVGLVRRGHRRPLLPFRRRRACVSRMLCLQACGEHPSVLSPSLVCLALGQNPSWTRINSPPQSRIFILLPSRRHPRPSFLLVFVLSVNPPQVLALPSELT